MSKNIAYIIPGYGESHNSRKSYVTIEKFFKDNGIKPIFIPITWDLKKPIDFKNFNQQFLKKYKKNPNGKTYILGFSFGALIAFFNRVSNKT